MTERASIRYQIDLDRASRAITSFNASPCMQAAEHLIARSFCTPERALSPHSVHANVALLDSLWRTQLFREPGSDDRIAINLASRSDALLMSLAVLLPDDLLENPDRVYDIARVVLPAILNCAGESGQVYRQNYSFATKIFHWCTRHHFPIVDSRVRRSINTIQRQHLAPNHVYRDTTAMTLSYIDEYERWIIFYSDCIRSLGMMERERLVQVDCDSQLPHYRVRNSLLRVLDKVFYALDW